MRLKFLFLLSLIFFNRSLYAQYDGIEKDYYQFPILPNQSNYLSGTVGELRSSHFHAGLDIKTQGKEGLDVFAAAEGYVSRIRIGTGGYGNCVYIQHPNGTTTVYAHLQRFNDIIAQYALENQYKRESFSVNLFPKRGELKVEKGEVIGLSGNSGSSTGPHLHFEIRGANQEVLDPLKMGFQEITDDIPPRVERLALKTMDINSRVQGQFGRLEFDLTTQNGRYVVTDTLYAHGTIGIEVYAFDRHNGVSNRNGVPFISMSVNDEKHFTQTIDSIQFSKQKNIKVHTSYQARRVSRRSFGKLYVDDGNSLTFYDLKNNDGYLDIKAGDTKTIDIIFKDSYGNESKLSFIVKGVEPAVCVDKVIQPKTDPFVIDNTLVLKSPRDSSSNRVTVYKKQGSFIKNPDYYDDETNVYLIDLRKSLPQRVMYANGVEDEVNFSDRVPAASEHSFLSDTYSLRFPRTSLFDTIYVRTDHYLSKGVDILEITDDLFPLKGSIRAEMQLLGTYDSIEQYHVYQVSGSGRQGFVGGSINDGKATFDFGGFGKFTLLKDETGPEIKQKSRRNEIITFTIKDNLSGINNFEAKLNGEWILMNYEPKKNLLWSERLDKTKPLKGMFELRVSDNAGNESNFTLNIK